MIGTLSTGLVTATPTKLNKWMPSRLTANSYPEAFRISHVSAVASVACVGWHDTRGSAGEGGDDAENAKMTTVYCSEEILECMPNLKSAFRHAALRQCDPEQTGLWESGRVAWDLAAHVMPLTLALSTRQRSDGLMTT